MNTPTKIVVHHTGGSDSNPLQDSSNFTFEQCNEQHRLAFNMKSSLGFYIGYHYYISKDGTTNQGRLDTDEGAHTIGQNTSSIGICLAGNFDATLPTELQKAALTDLLKKLTVKYGISPSFIYPHRMFAQKTCYGNKLADDWARSLITPIVIPSPPISTNKEKAAKAQALIAEATAILKTIN